MFINYTNHPSDVWTEKQRSEAMKYGEITDIRFPIVSPKYSTKEVEQLAVTETERILQRIGNNEEPHMVMCQGEFSLTFAVVTLLRQKAKHIKVVCAVSDRITREKDMEGKTIKEVEYEFKGFREYV